jgi:hypothetical protein
MEARQQGQSEIQRSSRQIKATGSLRSPTLKPGSQSLQGWRIQCHTRGNFRSKAWELRIKRLSLLISKFLRLGFAKITLFRRPFHSERISTSLLFSYFLSSVLRSVQGTEVLKCMRSFLYCIKVGSCFYFTSATKKKFPSKHSTGTSILRNRALLRNVTAAKFCTALRSLPCLRFFFFHRSPTSLSLPCYLWTL